MMNEDDENNADNSKVVSTTVKKAALKPPLGAPTAKNDSANVIAHEVRNGIHNINANTLELESCIAQLQSQFGDHVDLQPLLKQMRACLEATALASDGILAVVNNQLDYAKLTAEKMALNPRAINLKKLLIDLIKVFQARAQQKEIGLHLTLPPTDLWIKSDSAMLNGIFSNFLSNALKFTHHGAITLHVAADTVADDLVSTTISISDTGIGMSPAAQQQLFQAFKQVHHNAAGTYGGTGLGLVIAKKFIELLNGQVSTQSVPGEGTTFTLNFTFAIPTLQEQLALSMPHPLTPAPVAERAPLRILVVDDDPVSLKCTEKLMAGMGHVIETSASGLQAIEKYQNDPIYDVILMDMNLEDVNGLEATKAIRVFESKRRVTPCSIVIVSGDVIEFNQEYAMTTSTNAYLIKPVSSKQLQACLASLSQEVIASAGDIAIAAPAPVTSVARPLSASNGGLVQRLKEMVSSASQDEFARASNETFEKAENFIGDCSL